MQSVKAQFLSWKAHIQKNDFVIVLHEFEEILDGSTLKLEDEIQLANRCLRLINIKSQETLKDTSIHRIFLKDLFLLAERSCLKISESWNSLTVDFTSSIFYICKLLVAEKLTKEAIIIAKHSFEYYSNCDIVEKLNINTTIDVPAAFLFIFLNGAEQLTVASGDDDIFDLWSFILSLTCWRNNQLLVSKTVEFFTSFIFKITVETFRGNSFKLISLLDMFTIQISELEYTEIIFLKFLRSIISQLCDFSSESRFFFVNILTKFLEKRESAAVSICRRILHITNADEKISHLVCKINEKLQLLVKSDHATLNDVVYLSSTIIIKKRLDIIKGNPPDVNSTPDFLELLLTLAENLYKIDLNELFHGEKRQMKRIDVPSVAFVAADVLFVANVMDEVKNLDLRSPNIYEWILKAQKLLLKCVSEIIYSETARKYQVLRIAVAVCLNTCRALKKRSHYSQCKEISLKALQCFSHLNLQDLSDSVFKVYLEKLVMCLCISYFELEMYKNSLITSLSWIFIAKNSAKSFIETYCFIKSKISSIKPKISCLDLTCMDVLQLEENQWKCGNKYEYNLPKIILMELQACVKYKLNISRPVMKLLSYVDTLKLSPVKKAKYYCIATRIVVNTVENLSEAKLLSKKIEIIVQEMEELFPDYYKRRLQIKLALGDLYQAKFKIGLLSMRSENEAEVKLLESTKPKITQSDTEKDLKDAYDFVTASYTYSSQKEMMKVLNKAVDYWREAINKILESKDSSEILMNWELSLLNETALIYRMYCDITNEIKTLELLYTVAKFAGNHEMAVYAISSLMCTSWEIILKWVKETEDQWLPKASEKIALQYRLDYLSKCLERGLTPEEVDTVMHIEAELPKNHYLRAKYYFLIARCYFTQNIKNSKDPYAASFCAYNLLRFMVRNGQWGDFIELCELQCLLFDVTLFLISRDVEKYCSIRFYLNDTFSLIQKLGLPLRTCQFLNVSARWDAITGCIENCYVKIIHVCRILDRRIKADILKPHFITTSSAVVSDLRCAPGNSDFDFENIKTYHSDMKFQMPDFASHNFECNCDVCDNYEYLRLYCEVMSLFAVYFDFTKKSEEAKEYFEGVLQLLTVVLKRYRLDEMKVSCLVQYSNYWAARGHFKEAEICNESASQLLATIQNSALIEDCEEQTLYLWVVDKFKEKKNGDVKVRKKHIIKSEPSSSTAYLFKTPTRILKPVFGLYEEDEESIGYDVTPNPRKSRRALTFEETKTPMPSRKTTERKKNVIKNSELQTPPDFILNLPSTAKKRGEKSVTGVNSRKIKENESTAKKIVKTSSRLRKMFEKDDSSIPKL